MNRISTCFASLLLSCALTAQAQQYQLNSPDGKLIVNIEAGQADRKSTRLNSSHWNKSRMPSSA